MCLTICNVVEYNKIENFPVMNMHVVVLWIMAPCNDVTGYQNWYPTTSLHGAIIQNTIT
jgi:hypothetical protein